jgi:hypothetical protein
MLYIEADRPFTAMPICGEKLPDMGTPISGRIWHVARAYGLSGSGRLDIRQPVAFMWRARSCAGSAQA